MTTPAPRWGLRHVAVSLLVGWLASTVVLSAYLLATDNLDGDADIPLGVTAIVQAALWVGMLGGPIWVSRRHGSGRFRRDFAVGSKVSDIPFGMFWGALTQLAFVPLLYVPIFWFLDDDADLSEAARELTESAEGWGIALLVLVVAVGAPVIEEVFFRGMLLGVLRARFSDTVAVITSSLVFGIAHLQLLQLPALVLFGLVTAILVVRYDRLGPAIWAHVAFNGITLVVLL